MPNSLLSSEFEKEKLYVLSGKPKVGKTSFAIHSYAKICKDKNLQNDSYGVISYSIKNDFIKGFEDMELLKVIADYQLLNSSCNVLFFDFKIKPALQNQYYSNREIWHSFFKALREEMTKDKAAVVLILPIPFKDENTNGQSITEDTDRLLYYYNQADKILLLNRPEYFDKDKGEQFGTTYLNIIDVTTKKSRRVQYIANFGNFMFEKV